MKKILFFIGFILSISSLVYGADIDERKTDVYFANGINTTEQQADDSSYISREKQN